MTSHSCRNVQEVAIANCSYSIFLGLYHTFAVSQLSQKEGLTVEADHSEEGSRPKLVKRPIYYVDISPVASATSAVQLYFSTLSHHWPAWNFLSTDAATSSTARAHKCKAEIKVKQHSKYCNPLQEKHDLMHNGLEPLNFKDVLSYV